MEKGPTGTHRIEKGPSRDFYDELQVPQVYIRWRRVHRYMSDGEWTEQRFCDELQASQMSNYRSHKYTSDEERTVWRFMMKCHSLKIENFAIEV
jgi:hypothetical protein